MATAFLRPDADSVDGNWTSQSGGTSLFDQIDETSTDDADYIKSGPNPVNDICKIRLSDPGGPGSPQEPMSVVYRYKKTGTGTVNLRVRLLEGTTERASVTHNNISTAFVDGTLTLTSPQFAAIGDFTNLFLEFNANPTSFLLDDITTTYLKGAYSLRKLKSSYSGSAVQLRNGSASLLDVGFDANGDFDTTTAAGHGASTIAKFYDQSGNGNDLVQATVADQPVYSANGLNGLPTIEFSGNGTTTHLEKSSFPMGTSTRASCATVVELTTSPASASNARVVCYDTGSGGVIGGIFMYHGSGPSINMYKDGVNRADLSVSLDTPMTTFSEWAAGGSATQIYANNVAGTGSSFAVNFVDAGILLLGAEDNGATPLGGRVSEFLIFAGGDVSSTDRGTINTSQTNYWL